MKPSQKSHALRRIASILAAAFVLILQAQLQSRAQIDLFLKVGDIVGESNDSIRKDFSIADAWSWDGIQTTIDPLSGAAKSTFHNLNITKPIDSATPKLMAACATGRHYDRATLILRKRGKTPVEFYRIILESVLISSVQHTASSDGEPSENISINYARIGVEYFQIMPTGAPVRFEFAWDIPNNRAGGVTFPTATDADADLLPDAWETQYGLDPTKNDADLDNDGDGATNFEEYIAGTNPTDPNQVFRAKLDLSGAAATLTMPTVPGKTYRILTSQSILGPFDVVQTIQATTDTTTLPTTFEFPTQYFKIEVLP
jgi:type VI secretion system secreted protein Hcp